MPAPNPVPGVVRARVTSPAQAALRTLAAELRRVLASVSDCLWSAEWTADEFGADALVIGAPARIWHQVAGSVPGWLARHAHCPVIVVP